MRSLATIRDHFARERRERLEGPLVPCRRRGERDLRRAHDLRDEPLFEPRRDRHVEQEQPRPSDLARLAHGRRRRGEHLRAIGDPRPLALLVVTTRELA